MLVLLRFAKRFHRPYAMNLVIQALNYVEAEHASPARTFERG